MQHPDNTHLQHTSKKTDKILENRRLQYTCTTIATYATPIYFCNTHMKHFQHTSEISETLETCNMQFQRNISFLLRRIEARQRVEFTGVELAGSVEIARSGGEGHVRSGGDGCGGSPHCAGGARPMHGVSSASSCA
jgi:hypothetical protein